MVVIIFGYVQVSANSIGPCYKRSSQRSILEILNLVAEKRACFQGRQAGLVFGG